MSKQQLNLFVDEEVSEEFKATALQLGYGKKAAPLLASLLDVFRPNYQAVFKRLDSVFKRRPELTSEDIFYLERLRDLINKTLKQHKSSQRPE